MVAARSIRFNTSGTKLVAGLKNQIRIFDVAVPGRVCETVKTFDKKEGGLSGIISSIAVSSIVPESITGTKDEVDSDNNPVHQSIDQRGYLK